MDCMEMLDNLLHVKALKYFTFYSFHPKPPADAREHMHMHYEIFILLEGHCTYEAEGKEYVLHPTEAIIIPPRHGHRVEYENFEREDPLLRGLFFRFTLDASKEHEKLYSYLSRVRAVRLNAYPEVITLIHVINHHNAVFSEEEFLQLQKSYTLQLLLLMFKFSVECEVPAPQRLDHITLHVLAYINQHLLEKISVQKIADLFSFATSHIAAIFKKDMGVSVMQYIKRRRMALADSLLYGGEKPIQAMYKCGYSDYSNFFKDFVAFHGTTPKQQWLKYRKEAPHGKN